MAIATTDSGDTLAAGLSWVSSAPDTISVNVFGLVSANRVGTANITAASGAVSGQLHMRVVDADLTGASATLSDVFVGLLTAELSASREASLVALIAKCADQLDAENVRGVDACLSDALGLQGADAHDGALLGILRVFFDHARRALRL